MRAALSLLGGNAVGGRNLAGVRALRVLSRAGNLHLGSTLDNVEKSGGRLESENTGWKDEHAG